MNIIEAIKSGKRIKRTGSNPKFFFSPKELWKLSDNKELFLEALVADDWEIEEEKVEITKSQLLKSIAIIAKEKAARKGNLLSIHGPYGQENIDSAYGISLLLEEHAELLKELGFK